MTTVLEEKEQAIHAELPKAETNEARLRLYAAWFAVWVRTACPEIKEGWPFPPRSDKSPGAEKVRAEQRELLLTCDREQVEAVYGAMVKGVAMDKLPHGVIGQLAATVLDKLIDGGTLERGDYKGYAFPHRSMPTTVTRPMTEKEAKEELDVQLVKATALPPLPAARKAVAVSSKMPPLPPRKV